MKTALLVLGLGSILSFGPRATYSQCWRPHQTPTGCACGQYVASGWLNCVPGPTCRVSGDCALAGCFLAGALVETRDGPTRIEDIRVGDEVLSVSEDGGALEYQRVVDTYRVVQVEYYLINGAVRVTASHPFRVNSVWVDSDELEVGDELTSMDGESVIVKSIERIEFGVRAYNIAVSGNHTFFVNGLLVHNKPPNPGG